MNLKIHQLITALNEQLNFNDLEIDDPIIRCENAIAIILRSLEKLKSLFAKLKLKSQEQEIYFFRHIKPQFTSKLVYYNFIYKMETKMPHGGNKIVKKYLNSELGKLKGFFDSNLDFYKYHRTGNNYLDYKYFVRGNFDIKLTLDSFYFEMDRDFSTSHDFKVAEIMAHDLIQVYIEDRLLKLSKKKPKEKSQVSHKGKQTWTGSKVALTELLYALHAEGVFNNGTSDLKEVAECFEEAFNIDLGQYHRAFIEIRERKTDPTKFLSTLKETLSNRMANIDELA